MLTSRWVVAFCGTVAFGPSLCVIAFVVGVMLCPFSALDVSIAAASSLSCAILVSGGGAPTDNGALQEGLKDPVSILPHMLCQRVFLRNVSSAVNST